MQFKIQRWHFLWRGCQFAINLIMKELSPVLPVCLLIRFDYTSYRFQSSNLWYLREVWDDLETQYRFEKLLFNLRSSEELGPINLVINDSLFFFFLILNLCADLNFLLSFHKLCQISWRSLLIRGIDIILMLEWNFIIIKRSNLKRTWDKISSISRHALKFWNIRCRCISCWDFQSRSFLNVCNFFIFNVLVLNLLSLDVTISYVHLICIYVN